MMSIEEQNGRRRGQALWGPVGWAFVALNVVALVSLLLAHVDRNDWNLPPPGSRLSLGGEHCECLRGLVGPDAQARAICLVFSGNCPFDKEDGSGLRLTPRGL